jgi:serine/threonine protein kinase
MPDPPVLPGLNPVRLLGRGGYAEVYLYEQTNPRMRVAVKVLFAESLSPTALDQFAAEANTMAQLADHPNIVQVFRSDVTDDGRPYLVMKYYPQRNLAMRASLERLSVHEVLQIGIRIACAVETAHRAGILHRDIKPANILSSQYGEPGLTDFGIATTGAEGEHEAEGLSIPWSPPEVVFGTASAGRTTDVYSLGATLWHLLVGHSPFEEPGVDTSSIAMMRRIRESSPPRTGRDDVPASLERLLAQTMAKSPQDRPQSALQLARALQEIESEQRWSTTPLVLLGVGDEGGHGDDRDESGMDALDVPDDEPTTRAKRPQDVASQPVVAPADDEPQTLHRQERLVVAASPDADEGSPARPSPFVPASTTNSATSFASNAPVASAPSPSRAPRSREGMPGESNDPATIRRPVAVAAAGAEEQPAPETPETSEPSRRWVRVVVPVALVLVVALGAGVFIASHGSSEPGAPTVATGHQSAPTIVTSAQTPNAPTDLQSRRVNPTQVAFTWTIPGQQPKDKVWWVDSGDASQAGTQHLVQTNSAIVAATGQVCITVYVQEGTAVATSSPSCGGGS